MYSSSQFILLPVESNFPVVVFFQSACFSVTSAVRLDAAEVRRLRRVQAAEGAADNARAAGRQARASLAEVCTLQ